ncbi:MAG: shikimate kinase [Gammaproteobacteria bacterium]|nr:shikimate kinase [Gammaproteobacteria bacterium]
MRLRHHIYLIGLMGAGKTTVGRRLAKLLDCDFIDTDQALEARTGVSVSYIFELEGEAGFRAREAQLLAEISRGDGDGDRGRDGDGDGDRHRDRGDNPGRHPGAVIATGGGIILRADNRRVMRACGRVIYLRAALHLLQARLQNCDSRPLLSAPDPAAKIAQLLAERGPLYAAEADHIIDVTGAPAARVANQIHDLLRDELEHRQH